jgi:hypothetical protein
VKRGIGPILELHPEWVNDDSGLIGRCLREHANDKGRQAVVLVSGDRRLANQMAETCNVTVHRIMPTEFVRLACESNVQLDEQTTGDFLRKYGVPGDHIYIDTGSVMAAAATHTTENGVFLSRIVHSTGWEDGTRFSRITLLEVPRKALKKETHFPVTRPKVWRAGSRPHESAYSSHSSWKETVRNTSESGSWRTAQSHLSTVRSARGPSQQSRASGSRGSTYSPHAKTWRA